jgi:hypothetical protein
LYLTGVHPMGIYLIGMHLTGMYLMSVYLISVHLMVETHGRKGFKLLTAKSRNTECRRDRRCQKKSRQIVMPQQPLALLWLEGTLLDQGN